MNEHNYTIEQTDWLKNNVIKFPNKELTKRFNKLFGTNLTPNAIYRKVSRLGLRKKIGHYARYAVGAERKNEDGYTYIKIKNPDRWVPKQKYIYEQYYGEIPKSSIVIFLDKDKNNFNIDNLYLIDRDVFTFASTRGLLTENAELTKTGILLAELVCKTTKRKINK